MANFDRNWSNHIIIDRIDLTSKYGLRFCSINNNSSIGEGVISQFDIRTSDSINDIPLIENINRQTLEIPIEIMPFQEDGKPRQISDTYIKEVSRLLVGDKKVKELRVGDYLYYGIFSEVVRKYIGSKIGYFSCKFKMVAPNCYSIRLLDEIGVDNGSATIQISNRSSGTEYLYPDIFIKTQSACSYINITNANDNSVFELINIPSNANIYFYGDNMNQFEDKNKDTDIDYFDKWNLINLRLVYGQNTIQLSSDGKCSVGIIFQNELALF